MTTKPKFMKPFNLEHARAGAPIAIRHGDEVFLVAHVPEAVSQSRVIFRFKNGQIGTRRENGKHYEGGEQESSDLVMLPLGLIDGKPVFMGDELVTKFGDKFVVSAKHIGHLCEENTWPAPAPVYPTFDGSVDMLSIEYSKNNNYRDSLICVANFALRHAIDAGQVVLPGDTAARDMAVAVAVNNAAADIALKAQFVFALDLPTIIAGVAK